MRIPTAASLANAQNICATAQDDQHLSFHNITSIIAIVSISES